MLSGGALRGAAQVLNVTNLMSFIQGGAGRGDNARITQPLGVRGVTTTWQKTQKSSSSGSSGSLSSQLSSMLSDGNLAADAGTAHAMAQAVAALAVIAMLFCCCSIGSGAYMYVQHQEIKTLKRGSLASKDALSLELGTRGDIPL